jgi:hypothetical protein
VLLTRRHESGSAGQVVFVAGSAGIRREVRPGPVAPLLPNAAQRL